MKRNRLILFLMLLLSAGTLCAQEDEPDSIVVLGSVVNRLSGQPEPFCQVHFLRGSDTVATAFCDDEGYFGIDRLQAGTYGLSVELHGMTLYQADLVLNDNALLNLSVIIDSFQLRNLREVQVVAPKHMLGGLQITSPNDIRLWDMSGKMDGDAGASNSCDPNPNNPERRVKWGLFYRSTKGRENDRIWQIIWPDKVLPAPKDIGKKEAEKEEK